MRSRAAAVLALAWSLAVPPAFDAQSSTQQGSLTGVVVATRTDAENREALLLKVPAQVSGRAVDEIRVRIGRDAARAAAAALVPDGWTAVAASDELRLSGPARPDAGSLIARFVSPGSPAASGASRAVMAALKQARLELFAGGDRLLRAEVPVERRAPIDADVPLDSVIGLPPVITAGETITMKPYDLTLTPFGGSWTFTPLDAAAAAPDVSPPVAEPAAAGATADYSFDLSVGASFTGAGLKLGVKYTDEYGDVIVDAEPPTLTLLPEPAGEGASISGCTTKSFRGRVICVCGYFPDEGARARLTIDGTPLGAPMTSSKRVLFFRLPDAIGPGPHTIALAGAAGSASIEVLELSGQIDQKELLRGQSTPIHIRIAGTRDPLSLRLVNHSPGIITLDGGNDQVIETSGGDANTYSGMVRGHTPGDFRLTYELTAGRCPCGDSNETTEGLPDGETWYDDTRERFRLGRDLANDARDADLNGDDRAKELAAEALAELERARAALKSGVASGDIGPESAKLFDEYITAYESQVRVVSTPGPTVPLTPPPADDPRDAPPPVIFGEEIDTPEITVTDGWFQPSQGVWQDDDDFKDAPGKRLTRTGAATWHAELKMVAGRSTALFGIRDDTGAPKHTRIHIKGETTATTLAKVRFRFTLIQGGKRTTVYEQPADRAQDIFLDGPSGPKRGWSASLTTGTGVPDQQLFTFTPGAYALEAELIRHDTGQPTGLKVIVSGEAVTTTAPALHFVPVALGDMGRSGQAVLGAKARTLAAQVAARLPAYLPVADNGITASAQPLQQFPEVQPGVLRELVSMLPLADDSDTVRRSRLVAAMTNWLGTQAALIGGGKVVAILQRDEFDNLWPDDDAAAFASSQKLMVATNDAYVDTIGHELVHTTPFLWSRDEMAAAFGFSYHNNDDRNYADGVELFPARTRHDAKNAMMGPAAGPPWVTQGTYAHMLEQFQAPPDPPLIVTRGFLARANGRIAGRLDRLYEVMGIPDLVAGTAAPGQVAIELRDAAGASLGRFPFSPGWYVPDVEIDRPVVAFTFSVPDIAGAVEIALLGPDGAELHARRRSANAPVVEIAAPRAGARLTPQGGTIRVSWRGADADGDALTYMLLYSPDDGRTWRVVAHEIEGTSFDVPVTGRPAAARLRVVATDGARSGQAEVTFGFAR